MFKDYLLITIIAMIFLVIIGILDDSYENAQLSAQILDECIAQTNADQTIVTNQKY